MLESQENIKSTTIKIYVSNLGAYNCGTLTGDWTTLPVENIQDIYKKDKDKFGGVAGYGEEYFISDYEAPFDIDENEDIEQLNELAQSFENNGIEDIGDVYAYLDEPENITEPVYDFDETSFEELTAGMSKIDVARAVFFGNVRNWNDDYVRFNAYGNLETLSRYEWLEELNGFSSDIIREYKEENNL